MSRSVVRMLRAQVVAEQRIFWRNASTMFFAFVLPLVLLAMVAFGSQDGDALALVIALGVLSISFQGLAMQLSMHRDQGVLKGLMATPMSPGVFIGAKVLSLLIVVVLVTTLVLVVGIAATDAAAPERPLLLALFVVLGTAAFAAVGFAVASVIPTSDSAPAIVNAAFIGMSVLSFALAEVDALPDSIQQLATVVPLNQLIESIHDAWMGGDANFALAAVVLLGWGAAATAWTTRRFRWEPREAVS